MKKVMRIFWLVVLAAVVIGTFVYLWTKSRPKEVSYEILSPSIEIITTKAVATGKLEPRKEVLIQPQISGIISKIYTESGEKVQAGDVIALVQVIPEMSTLNAAESRVKVAKIDYQQAETEYKRSEKQFDNKLLIKEEYENSREN